MMNGLLRVASSRVSSQNFFALMQALNSNAPHRCAWRTDSAVAKLDVSVVNAAP
jgi:hypothetical protein